MWGFCEHNHDPAGYINWEILHTQLMLKVDCNAHDSDVHGSLITDVQTQQYFM